MRRVKEALKTHLAGCLIREVIIIERREREGKKDQADGGSVFSLRK
jgi:hypothetical protein